MGSVFKLLPVWRFRLGVQGTQSLISGSYDFFILPEETYKKISLLNLVILKYLKPKIKNILIE
jgi:hypothetical protein